MGGLPPDSRYVTGGVPPEMRQGTELTDSDVARPTERFEPGVDGVTEQIQQIRVPRPDHIPATPRFEPTDDRPLLIPGASRSLRYDFPLFPDVQCRIVFEGPATADHLDQLCEYLTVARDKLKEQQARTPAVTARTPTPRKVKPKKEPTNGN